MVKRLKCPFIRCETSGCLMPEQRRDLTLLELPVCQNLVDMKAQSRPREQLVGILEAQVREDIARAFLELDARRVYSCSSSAKLLRLFVSLLDQIHILLWRRDAFLRFLLEGMQHIDVPAELECHHRAVCLAVMPKGDLE